MLAWEVARLLQVGYRCEWKGELKSAKCRFGKCSLFLTISGIGICCPYDLWEETQGCCLIVLAMEREFNCPELVGVNKADKTLNGPHSRNRKQKQVKLFLDFPGTYSSAHGTCASADSISKTGTPPLWVSSKCNNQPTKKKDFLTTMSQLKRCQLHIYDISWQSIKKNSHKLHHWKLSCLIFDISSFWLVPEQSKPDDAVAQKRPEGPTNTDSALSAPSTPVASISSIPLSRFRLSSSV